MVGRPFRASSGLSATELSHRLFRLFSDPVISHVTYSSAVRAGLARTGGRSENNLALRANPHLRLTNKRAPLEPTSSVNCYSSQLTCSRKRFRIRSLPSHHAFEGSETGRAGGRFGSEVSPQTLRPESRHDINGGIHGKGPSTHLFTATGFIDRLTNCSARVVTNVPNAAGYATLREIEGRLKSIKNIEKITKTMKIVASTKLTRAQRAMTESRAYGQTSNEVYQAAETKPLETEKKTLLVVCSSDKGLCGGVHSGLSRAVRRMTAEKPQHYDLVVIGEKAKAQLGRTHANDIQLSFSGVGKDVPSFAEAQAISEQILDLSGEYDNVQILYNRFINATSYEPSTLEAFSEEAITESRRSLQSDISYVGNFLSNGSMLQPTSPPSRLMRILSPT